jgi:hypothetical protein
VRKVIRVGGGRGRIHGPNVEGSDHDSWPRAAGRSDNLACVSEQIPWVLENGRITTPLAPWAWTGG